MSYYKFPKDKDRAINIGDCCPLSGNCDGHPGSSHGNLLGIDLDYFTHLTNTTQYKSKKIPITKIWKIGNEYERSILSELDKNIFHWERNFYTWELIYTIFPYSKMHIDLRIHDYMIEKIENKYGLERTMLFRKHVLGGHPMSYNHDTHIHITIRLNETGLNLEESYDNILKLKLL